MKMIRNFMDRMIFSYIIQWMKRNDAIAIQFEREWDLMGPCILVSAKTKNGTSSLQCATDGYYKR